MRVGVTLGALTPEFNFMFDAMIVTIRDGESRMMSGTVNPPVVSLTYPTAYGPRKPPNCATELMKAMPPAAAVPVR